MGPQERGPIPTFRASAVFVLAFGACFDDPPSLPTDSSSGGNDEMGTSTDVGDSTTTIDLDTTVTEGMTETTATTGPPPTCDEPDGTFEGMCSGTAPFCVGGECVPCSPDEPLTACAQAPETVCDASGECVVCSAEDFSACMGETPYCDTSTSTCVPCTEHAQCGISACNLFTGACVAGPVVNIGAGQSLSDALGMVTPGGGGTIIVGQGTYDVSLVVNGSVTVAFLANGNDRPVWQRTTGAGAPQLRATAGATVLVDGFDFRLNTAIADPAIRVDDTDSRLWVDRSIVAQNSGAGLLADFDGLAVLRNCFVLGANNRAAVEALMGGALVAEFSTLGGSFGTAPGLSCDAVSSATASDSIILSLGATDVACASLAADHTAATTDLGGDNSVVGAVDDGWFSNYDVGDFHLSATGQTTFMDIAEWNDGDPLVDIDGVARSGVDGTMEHAGADLP
jgi:hypothetical protein